jgi:hypothetical protein
MFDSKKSFPEMKELKDDFDPDKGDDEPLKPDVVLVAQMSSYLKKGKHGVE